MRWKSLPLLIMSDWGFELGSLLLVSRLDIYLNYILVLFHTKYDCWKRGGFICSSDFEMRVYLLRGKFETVEVLFATRKLSRLFSLRAMWAKYCSFEKLYCIKSKHPNKCNI